MRSPGNSASGNTEKRPSPKWGFHPRAKKEIKAIVAYFDSLSPSAAETFEIRLHEALDLLAGMPLMGRMARSTRMLRKGYRCFIVDEYNLYYKPKDTGVEVYAVVHAARKADSEC